MKRSGVPVRPQKGMAVRVLVLTGVMAFVVAVMGSLMMGVAGTAQAAAKGETTIGYSVIDVATGRVLAAENVRTPLLPASVAKLPSAFALLDIGKGERRFQTRLIATAPIRNGVLDGDLYLVGGGDPMVDHAALQDMAAELGGQGLTRITGHFFYDTSAIPTVDKIDPGQPGDAAYNAPVSALSVDFNRVLVTWKSGTPKPAELDIPTIPAAVPPAPPPGETWMPLPVNDPGLFAALVFQAAARAKGITLPAPTAGAAPASGLVLTAHDSPALADILGDALFYSNNIAMETLGMGITRAPDLAGVGATIEARVKALYPSIDWDGMVLNNTSGLSPNDRLTPAQCGELARKAATETIGGTAIRSILPDVSVAEFGHPSHAATREPAHMQAKSGTMFYARALAGFFTARSGREIAFCVMQEDRPSRLAYEALPEEQRKTGPARSAAHEWVVRTREVEKALVTGWIAGL